MSTKTTNTPKRPTHRILQIEDRGEGKKAYWREVGVAFTNGDGSQNLVFAVIPMIGQHTIQLREIDYTQEQEEDAGNKNRGSRK